MKITDKNGKLLAVFMPPQESAAKGTAFITDASAELQMGILNWTEGHSCKPHTHISSSARAVKRTNEAYFVQSGKMLSEIYDDAGILVASLSMRTGDVLLCLGGGHSFTAETDTRVVEIKQGPFDASDKVFIHTTQA